VACPVIAVGFSTMTAETAIVLFLIAVDAVGFVFADRYL
jgi:hypothetical protein